MGISAFQNTVNTAPDYGIPGQLATMQSQADAKVDTYVNEEASASIPFGYFVMQGTVEARAKLPSGKTSKLVGLVVFGQSYARTNGEEISGSGLAPGTAMSVLREGTAFVLPTADVVPNDTGGVHVFVTAHSGSVPGQCTNTEDGVYTIDISPFAQWETAGGPTSGEVARLTVDFTNAALAVTDS